MNRKMVYINLIFALLLSLSVPAFAANEEATETSQVGTYSRFEVLEPEGMDELITAFVKERKLSESNFGVSLLYTATGETWSWNGDTWFVGRSLYKVPLNMILANKVYNGELSWDEEIYSDKLSEVQEQSLVYSKNEIAERFMKYLGGMPVLRTVQQNWIGYAEEALPGDYLRNNTYSANAMVGIFKELYVNQEFYPNVIDQLKKANPGEYFKTNLEDEYTIAQKYGGGEGQLHCAGIIYMEQPVILCIMTQNAPHRENLIADLSEMIADYMQDVNIRLEQALEKEAEEKAEAEKEAAERKKIAAEKAKEAAASREKAAEEAKAQREAAIIANAGRTSAEIVAGVGAAAVVLVVIILRKREKDKE